MAPNALEILRTETVDVVTLDLNMPGIDGEDVMRTMRRDFPQIEVVVITGCGSVESAAEGIRHGICDYLQKPFDVVQVGAAVKRALTRQRARARLTSFHGELGDVVGRDRDTHAILVDVQRSQKMRGRLDNLFETPRGPCWATKRPIPRAPPNSSRCWPRRSRTTTAACAVMRVASPSTRR